MLTDSYSKHLSKILTDKINTIKFKKFGYSKSFICKTGDNLYDDTILNLKKISIKIKKKFIYVREIKINVISSSNGLFYLLVKGEGIKNYK